MNARENYLRAATRRNPQWIPLDFGVSQGARAMFRKHLGPNVDFIEYFKFDARWIGASSGTTDPRPDWRKLYYTDGSLPPGAWINPEWGTATLSHAATDDARSFYPLRHVETVEQLDAYPWPSDVGAPHRYKGVAEEIRAWQEKGHAVCGGGPNFFEHPWGLCGFDKLMMGMAADEPWARRLFAKHAEGTVRVAERIAEAGADILQTGSDVATQLAPLMSPAMWREWLFPLMRDAFAAARKIKPDILVLYHSDGNVEPLIEGFIEAGVDILNPIQPECMDIFALKKEYGERLSFHGGIGVQSVMPFGTATQVRDTVRRTIEGMSAGGGGYLCSTAHMIRPEVPWENIMALVETVKEFGHP